MGVDDATPQEVAALMQSDGPNSEGLPTRQNIESDLQKYRLLLATWRHETIWPEADDLLSEADD